MSDVDAGFTFAEALTGLTALRDYTRLRREWNMPEDAIMGHFYHALLRAIQEGAQYDPEGWEAAYALVKVPVDFGEEGSNE